MSATRISYPSSEVSTTINSLVDGTASSSRASESIASKISPKQLSRPSAPAAKWQSSDSASKSSTTSTASTGTGAALYNTRCSSTTNSQWSEEDSFFEAESWVSSLLKIDMDLVWNFGKHRQYLPKRRSQKGSTRLQWAQHRPEHRPTRFKYGLNGLQGLFDQF